MPPFSSRLAPLLALWLSSPPAVSAQQLPDGMALSLVPEGLLDFFPADCMGQLEKDVLPCAMSNLCLTLLPTEDELAAIPSEDEITSCEVVEAALCPITSRCPPCGQEANDFFRCTITSAGADLSQNVTDLIAGCSLDCATFVPEEEDEDEVSGEPLPPTVAPVEATPSPTYELPAISTSKAPSGAPIGVSDSSDTEAPTASSGASMGVGASVATVSSLAAMVALGW